MVLRSSLIGSESMVRERVLAYARVGVTTLRADPAGRTPGERLETLGRLMDIVRSLPAS
jgi:hypothetical protein